MISNKIDKLNMKYLTSIVGFPRDPRTLEVMYKLYSSLEDKINDFKRELMESLDNSSKIRELFGKYDEIFDKEQFLFVMTKILETDLEGVKKSDYYMRGQSKVCIDGEGFISARKNALSFAKNLLKNSDVVTIIKENDDTYTIESTLSMQGKKYILEKREKKAKQRLEEIDHIIGLGNITMYLLPSDLLDICRYRNLGNYLASNLYKFDEDDLEEYAYFEGDKKINKTEENIVNQEQGRIFSFIEFEDAISKYIGYIDIDKMLILANTVYYQSQVKNIEELTLEDLKEMEEFTEKIEALLEKKNKQVQVSRFKERISLDWIKRRIEGLHKRFIGGKILSDEEIYELANNILDGVTDITTLTPNEFKNLVTYEIEEISIILRNQPKALDYLIKNKLLSEEELNKLFDFKNDFSDEQILYLISNKVISDDKIVDMYQKENITLENIKFAKENLKEKDFEKLVSEKELIKLYREAEKTEEFDKYKKLYKFLKVDNRTLEEKRNNAEKIIEQSEDLLLEEEKMYEFYHMGIFPVDTIVDFIGDNAIVKLFSSGDLKPNDARRLYESGIITEKMLDDIFSRKDLDETNKLVLIYSTFSSDEEKDVKLREKFVKKYIQDVIEFKNKEKPSKGGRIIDPDKEPANKKRKALDPCARWNLISNLDNDYSQQYLQDGNIIFYLPNQGKYVIEKLYSTNKKIAYGTATYILEEEVFNEQKDFILQNGKINSKNLVSLKKQKLPGVYKFVHTGWANAITKFFDIENPEKYSEERKEKIKKIAERVEKSKRPLTLEDD